MAEVQLKEIEPGRLLGALRAVKRGDFSVRLPLDQIGIAGEIAEAFNDVAELLDNSTHELARVSQVVGKEGKIMQRAVPPGASGGWAARNEFINGLIGDLVQPTVEVARVIGAVAQGDLSQRMALEIEGRPLEGEFLRIVRTVNTVVDQLGSFASEVTRVAREVGTEGKLGGQAVVAGVAGTWKDLTDSVNSMAANLTGQVRNIAEVTTAVAKGDLSKKITVDVKGEILELKDTINTMVDQLSSFASEVTRVAREVGTEGKLGGQALVKGVAGTWKDLTDNVNMMAANLTGQVRNIADVTTAVANGDLSKKITVDVKGEILQLKNTINTMVDQLGSFAAEVTRVAREVGTEGRLGGQAQVRGVAGTWKDLTDNVNMMASNLTGQVRNIAEVTTAVARGDLSKKITVDVKGEILELKNTVNIMVDQLSSFASEVTRVAREVGTDGKLGGQAEVRGVAGTWRDLTDSVNSMAANLTSQVRNIAHVTTAVANGDLSKKITVNVKGEILELKDTINTMVDQLGSFASEVTRVAREVGTEGKLGGQALVKGVAGTWKDLTDNVNMMAANLTAQVRGIAKVVTAVAKGDLAQKLTVESKGEIAALSETINEMNDTLATFAEQVTTVAREVGVEGKLGGQAKVPGAAGTWRDLTDNVNQLAANLTTQVRAIAEVATAVTKGDLTRSITVKAQGEVASLKDNINEMIRNLKETTQKNTEQDWLKTNLAKFTRMLQGQRDLMNVAKVILSELAPVVSAQHGVFYVMESDNGTPALKLLSSYAYKERKQLSHRFALGEGVVGQCALEKQRLVLSRVPRNHISIRTGLGESRPRSIAVLPVIFEGEVKAVIELASFNRFSDIHLTFLDQLTESIGIVLNTIAATMRTEELLKQSQALAEESQVQQEELKESNTRLEEQADSLRASQELLQKQQEQLQQTNEELERRALQLTAQKAEVEGKNREIELAKLSLQERAEQLALTSKYKSEFLANMSHELRTPLNSLLLLGETLADNRERNLTPKQVECAKGIYASGADLRSLISDILDMAKIESGAMTLDLAELPFIDLQGYVERAFGPVAEHKGLDFRVELGPDLPKTMHTDGERVEQVLRNLLSNAFKFTEHGGVQARMATAVEGWSPDQEALNSADTVIALAVTDTGIGIAPDKLKIIFEPFQQADTGTSRKYGGTGLGLSISREIATLLGGEIRVNSAAGKGSTFTLYLPQNYVPPAAKPAATPGAAPKVLSDGPEVRSAPREVRARSGNGVPALRQPAPTNPAFPEVRDDRAGIQSGDRVLLIVENDATFARILLDMARERGFKGIIALRGESALALAHQYPLDAITLDIRLPDMDGWKLLEYYKSDLDLRHIPVHIISVEEDRQRSLKQGALAFLKKPVNKQALAEAFSKIHSFLQRRVKNLLVVEADAGQRGRIVELIGDGDVHTNAVGTGDEAMDALRTQTFDCMVLDPALPDMPGIELIARIKKAGLRDLPIVVYTGKELTADQENELEAMGEAIIIKDVKSPERLLDETALFLHRVEADLPEAKKRILRQIHDTDPVFVDRKVLVVDDDFRNIFALTSVLERQRMQVVYAENGRAGIEVLRANPDIDIILMDIMMPEMDGYETMRAIRRMEQFRTLPMIALTAKAMKGDREKCIEAGASDYIPKPVNTEQLLSLLRVWLYRRDEPSHDRARG